MQEFSQFSASFVHSFVTLESDIKQNNTRVREERVGEDFLIWLDRKSVKDKRENGSGEDEEESALVPREFPATNDKNEKNRFDKERAMFSLCSFYSYRILFGLSFGNCEATPDALYPNSACWLLSPHAEVSPKTSCHFRRGEAGCGTLLCEAITGKTAVFRNKFHLTAAAADEHCSLIWLICQESICACFSSVRKFSDGCRKSIVDALMNLVLLQRWHNLEQILCTLRRFNCCLMEIDSLRFLKSDSNRTQGLSEIRIVGDSCLNV